MASRSGLRLARRLLCDVLRKLLGRLGFWRRQCVGCGDDQTSQFIAIVQLANGFLGTLVSMSSAAAGFSPAVMGIVLAAYFGGYINQNFIETAQALDLTENEIIQLAKNSFIAAFLTTEQKNNWHYSSNANGKLFEIHDGRFSR